LRIDRLDSPTKEAIRCLLQALIIDLKTMENESEPNLGWRLLDELNFDMITQSKLKQIGAIQIDNNKIRINKIDYRLSELIRDHFKIEHLQIEYLINLRKDRVAYNDALFLVQSLSEKINVDNQMHDCAIIIGIWKMLESSGMPGPINEILKEGFSPEDWTRKSLQASPFLALRMVNSSGKNYDISDIADGLISFGLPNLLVDNQTISQADLIKIIKVLKWEQIENGLDRDLIKTLGIFWFFLTSLSELNVFPVSDELLIKLYEDVWKTTESISKLSHLQTLDIIKILINDFENDQIIWIADIVRIPEVL